MNEEILKLLESENYKDRMKGEYLFVKGKYEKLHSMLVKSDAGTLGFKPDCNIDLFKEQAAAMGKYLYLLEVRAQIEGINL